VDQVKHRLGPITTPNKRDSAHQNLREAMGEQRALALIRVGKAHQRRSWRQIHPRITLCRDRRSDDAEQLVVGRPLGEGEDAAGPEGAESLSDGRIGAFHVHHAEGAGDHVEAGISLGQAFSITLAEPDRRIVVLSEGNHGRGEVDPLHLRASGSGGGGEVSGAAADIQHCQAGEIVIQGRQDVRDRLAGDGSEGGVIAVGTRRPPGMLGFTEGHRCHCAFLPREIR
jgi:hypothetical protein